MFTRDVIHTGWSLSPLGSGSPRPPLTLFGEPLFITVQAFLMMQHKGRKSDSLCCSKASQGDKGKERADFSSSAAHQLGGGGSSLRERTAVMKSQRETAAVSRRRSMRTRALVRAAASGRGTFDMLCIKASNRANNVGRL